MPRMRTEQSAEIGGTGRSARLGRELLSMEHFDLVDKADHRVIVKVMRGDMLENSLSDLDGGDDFHFHVAGFCVPRTDASGALAMDAITRITGGAESLHLPCKTELDVEMRPGIELRWPRTLIQEQ